jgi:hypothetical protein
MAAGTKRIVAIGQGPSGAAAWWSDDGLVWHRSPDQRSIRSGSFVDVVAGGPGFVAVGDDGIMGADGYTHGASWTSADGVHWAGPYTLPDGALGLIAVGRLGGTLFATGSEEDSDVPLRVWASDDGRTWRQSPLPSRPQEFGDLIVVASGRPGVLIGGSTSGPDGFLPTAFLSKDGHDWTRVGPFEGAGSVTGRVDPDTGLAGSTEGGIGDVVAFRDGFFAIGAIASPTSSDAAAWHSNDGQTWERVPDDVTWHNAALGALVVLPDGRLLAAGTSPSGPATWTSVDGQTWTMAAIPVEVTSPPKFVEVSDAIVSNSRLLVGGHVSDAATVWTDPLPPVIAETPAITKCLARPALIDLIEIKDPAHCYGTRSITFRGVPKSIDGGDAPPALSPRWLAPGNGFFVQPKPGFSVVFLQVYLAPESGKLPDIGEGQWLRVTGHFRDARASQCHWLQKPTPYVNPKTFCRNEFVATKIVKIPPP